MPLIPPALDDRSYDDLVQEMLASIPAHTPEWTTPQTGDPGRTVIELFAWLADTILYRANLIPEKQRIAFLRLLGEPMQAASAATGIVSLSYADTSIATATTLVQGAAISGPPAFETLGEVDVLPVTAQTYVKVPLTNDQTASSATLLTGLGTLYGITGPLQGYTTTPVFPGNMADPVGVDVTGSLDSCLWIALMAGKPQNLAATRATLGGAAGEQILSLGFVPSLPLGDPLAGAGTLTPVPVTWQISGGTPGVYYSVAIAGDTTNGLTQPGVVSLILPQTADIGAPPNDVRSDVQAGVGNRPPRVDDPNVDASLVAWIRINVSSALTLNWAGVNAVQIDQRTTNTLTVIGVSSGAAGQVFSVTQTQIDPTTFQLDVDMPGLGYQLWQAVDDLAVLQGPVPAFVLDPEAGTVTFGNQMQGLIPPMGRRIRVRLMRYGGGSAGNLPAAALTKVTGNSTTGAAVSGLVVLQPVATTGGAEAETLDQAEQRIPSRLRHQERAVTASDYQSLVEEMPGGTVGRVEVLPLFKPQTRDTNAPGVVSVMVIPEEDGVQPPCPRADRTLLQSVYSYLDPKRPAASEMYVIGTEYVGIGISIAVEVITGFSLLQVGRQVELALRSYLWPLAPGGLNQTGWPLGRMVRSLELEVAVSKVPGVSEVNGLLLFQLAANGTYQPLPVDGNNRSELTLVSWQLPELLKVTVATGADQSNVQPDATLDTTTPNSGPNTVAVPVVTPDLC
jgi:predicted phage baseplate assembly protein